MKTQDTRDDKDSARESTEQNCSQTTETQGTRNDSDSELSAEIEKSLRYSVYDGFFYSIKVGLANSFFSPFAILLQANNFQLGLLSTIPQVTGGLIQLFTHRISTWFRSRRRFVCAGALLQALMLLPMTLAFFLGSWSIPFLLLFTCLYWTFGMMIGPVWNSWMGDLVPESRRGGYFGSRNKILGLASFLSMLAGGYILHLFAEVGGNAYLGFCAIFGLALIARIISFYFLARQFEPEYRPSAASEVRFGDFARQLGRDNYGTFVCFMCLINFSVFFAAPFFSPYMLNELRLDYMDFTLVHASAVIAKFLVMGHWGRMCDRFGTRKILTVAGFAMPLVPALWFFSGAVWYLVAIQVYSGIVWAGFEIAGFNFAFDITERQKRVAYMAYYNAFIGISVLLGGMAGSLFVRYHPFDGSPYILVFVASGFLRYLASFFYLRKLREVRAVEPISYPSLCWKIVASFTTMGFLHHAFVPLKKHGHADTNGTRIHSPRISR